MSPALLFLVLPLPPTPLLLPQVRSSLAPSGLLLPHRLQLWVQGLESGQLAAMSHLTSDEPVLGLKVADQVNVLAVVHQQDLALATLEASKLTEPCRVTHLDLTNLDLDKRTELVNLSVTKTGKLNGLVYWWVEEFGWGLEVSSLEAGAWRQAAFLVQETRVEEGREVEVRVTMERGLLELALA